MQDAVTRTSTHHKSQSYLAAPPYLTVGCLPEVSSNSNITLNPKGSAKLLAVGLPLCCKANSLSAILYSGYITFLEYIPARLNSYILSSVVPFVSPDGVLSPLQWTPIVVETMRGGLADDILLCLITLTAYSTNCIRHRLSQWTARTNRQLRNVTCNCPDVSFILLYK